MRINAIDRSYAKPVLNKTGNNNVKKQIPSDQQSDTISFKGIKNAGRLGGIGALVGAIMGSFILPGLGTAAGAATMAAICGGVGAVRGLMESDKTNVLKE